MSVHKVSGGAFGSMNGNFVYHGIREKQQGSAEICIFFKLSFKKSGEMGGM